MRNGYCGENCVHDKYVVASSAGNSRWDDSSLILSVSRNA